MAESIFKVGDTVIIKERAQNEYDYRCGFTDTMARMAGKQFEITEVRPASSAIPTVPDDGHVYILKGSGFSWASSMFEDPNKCPLSAFIRKRKCPQLDFNL